MKRQFKIRISLVIPLKLFLDCFGTGTKVWFPRGLGVLPQGRPGSADADLGFSS